jgi:putative transposase
MLRSYTNAINKQQKRSGKLFREKTKAECVNCFNGPTPNFINSNDVNIQFAEDQYPQVLFNYIHQNPVKAKLVDDEIDWEFSSAIDFYGKRNGKLINKQTAKKYVNS